MGDKKRGQSQKSTDWSAFKYTVWPSGNGYEWKPALRPEPETNLRSAFATTNTDIWLVESEGKQKSRPYRPLEISDLHNRLAKLALSKSPEADVQSFANRYGLLGGAVRLYDPDKYPIDLQKKARIDQISEQMENRRAVLAKNASQPDDDILFKQLLADLNRAVDSYPHLKRPWFSGESLDFWLNMATELYVLIQVWHRVETNNKVLNDYGK